MLCKCTVEGQARLVTGKIIYVMPGEQHDVELNPGDKIPPNFEAGEEVVEKEQDKKTDKKKDKKVKAESTDAPPVTTPENTPESTDSPDAKHEELNQL